MAAAPRQTPLYAADEEDRRVPAEEEDEEEAL